MNEYLLILRIIIGFIFLSSAINKMLNYKSHKAIVKNYKILPIKGFGIIVFLEVLVEFTLSIMFLVGLFTNYAALGLMGLLIIYSIAILFNLLRGNKEISCGCGGIIGNHKISYKLIIRNFIILLIIGVIESNRINIASVDVLFLNNGSNSKVVFENSIIAVLVSLAIIMFYYVTNQLIRLKKLMNYFFLFLKREE